MTITTPAALVLLLAIPLVVYLGWPRNRFRRNRDITSLILRVIIIGLVVFALAGTQIVRSADRLAVVFLVDVSDSMGVENQEAAEAYIQQALDEMHPDDLAAVVVFGTDAQVARSMSSARELGPLRADPGAGNSNLAAAIRLGLALFPDDVARRLVVLSDGQETLGSAEDTAQLAAAVGAEISYVPFERTAQPDVLVQDVNVPTVIDQDQEVFLNVSIYSDIDTDATIRIQTQGILAGNFQEELKAGDNLFTWSFNTDSSEGFLDWMVSVEPNEDGFSENNKLGAFSRVKGATSILVVGEASETEPLIGALLLEDVQIETRTPNSVPSSVAGLAGYDAIVLANVSAVDLQQQSMQALESYVADLGGGLVVVGGPEAYGPGGYYQTPLEDALPVEMQIRDQERIPQLTIAYVIDRSGSMGAVGRSGFANIDLAKEAIIRSVDFLQPTDRAGVASFDTQAYWVANIQDVENRRELQRLIATLRPAGGTSIMAGMELVRASIIQEPSELKHIILLTDGGAQPQGLVQLSEELYNDHNVSTSVISIGEFEASFLQRMAEVGEGNYHNVSDGASIPTIFTMETVLATRTYIQEGDFSLLRTALHPIVDNLSEIPSLKGYVSTTPRAAAQVILRGPEPYQDPILAAWQYGLGRSVAFTSDATGRWGQDWVAWADFPTFWSQAVRWTITEGTSSNLESRVLMEGENARVIVDARTDNGNFMDGLDLEATVISPTSEVERVQLQQVAPGQYEAVFSPGDEGAYMLSVASGDSAPEGDELRQVTGWVMSYSPEYAVFDVDDRLLETVADLTDGQNMTNEPGLVFEHNLTARNASVPLWPWLLLAAMILLPFDVGVRRLLVTQSDLRRLSVWVQGTVLRGNARAMRQTARDEQMQALRGARERARSQTAVQQPATTIGALRSRTAQSREERVQQAQATQQPQQAEAKPRPRYQAPEPQVASKPSGEGDDELETNIGSRLLKRRRGQSDE